MKHEKGNPITGFLKVIIIIFICLGLLTLISNMVKAEEVVVPDDYFQADRVVDAVECTKTPFDPNEFLYCLNIIKICPSDIIQKPKGDDFGYKALVPVPTEAGMYVWEVHIYKASMTDTETKAWCTDNVEKFNKHIQEYRKKKYLREFKKSGKQII